MSAEDERWLRNRLTAVVDVEPPPADLATRAERTAGRIRRRRFGTAAAVAAVVVAVPLVLGGAGAPDRGLPPARPADPACVADDQALPQQPDAVDLADVTWPYRGDPALRPLLDQVIGAAVVTAPGRPVPRTRPLYAQRLAEPADTGVYVFASELPSGGPWLVTARTGPLNPPTRSSVWAAGFAASARLPQLRPTSQVSLLVPVPIGPGGPVPGTGWDRLGNLLVVLGPPGADRIHYTGCYRGRAFTVSGGGDVLVRRVGPVDAPGQVWINAGGRLLAIGEVGDPLIGYPTLALPAVEPIPVPADQLLLRLTGQGESQEPKAVPDVVRSARLLARCRGAVPLEVATGNLALGRVPCDEQVHVLADGILLDPYRPLSVSGVPQLRGGLPEPVSYEVVVVTAG